MRVMSVALRLKSLSVADLDEMPCAKNLYMCFSLTVMPDRCGFQEKAGQDVSKFA